MTKYIFVILVCFFVLIVLLGTTDKLISIQRIIFQQSVDEKICNVKGYFKDSKRVKTFINSMVKKHKFSRVKLIKLFSQVEFQFEALSMIAPQYRKKFAKYIPKKKNTKPRKRRYKKQGRWDRYKEYKITDTHIKKGLLFWKLHNNALKKAERIYGVPPEYIIAIIAIESCYGKNAGKYPAFDSLVTLAFTKHRRDYFFQKELESFLVMAKNQNFNIRKINSSFAGALGLGQFMPSNFSVFCVDFDNDNIRDLWNPKDAIGSIANYFKKNGWQKNGLVAVRAKYKGLRFRQLKTGYTTKYSLKRLKTKYKITPREKFNYNKSVSLIKLNKFKYDELWIGAKNFFIITRYNHSGFYAMAVHILAQKIKDAK